MIRRSRAEIVDFSEKEDEKISYCKECLKFGFTVPLKNRIYPNNEPIPADRENFLQCYECGSIYAVYEIEKEASIKDVVETVESPFENQTEIIGLEKRNSKTMGKQSRKRNRPHHKDPEIQRELYKGNIVTILYDTSR